MHYLHQISTMFKSILKEVAPLQNCF